MAKIRFILGVIALLSTIVHAVSTGKHDLRRVKRQSSAERLVFAHFMVNMPWTPSFVLDVYLQSKDWNHQQPKQCFGL